jgi:hypothetical protein
MRRRQQFKSCWTVAMPRNKSAMKHVILSDFSAGRTVMSIARGVAGMAAFLWEIWHFDGHGGASHIAERWQGP